MVVLGTFILAFGWFGFNAGSTLAGMDTRIAVIAVNTMLAGATGAFAAYLYVKVRFGKPDVRRWLCNGMLAGLVAITAPCAFVSASAAILIGAVAGVLVILAAAVRRARSSRSTTRSARRGPRRERRVGHPRARPLRERHVRRRPERRRSAR